MLSLFLNWHNLLDIL